MIPARPRAKPRALRARIVGLGTALLALQSPAPGAAQTSAALDLAATRVAYDGVPGASAFTLAPMLQVTRPLASLFAGANFWEVDGGGWSLQGSAAGSLFTPGAAGFRLEAGGSASGSTHEDGTSTGSLLGRARLHWMAGAGGVWGGGGLGRATDGLGWRATREIEAGAWLRGDPVTLLASAAPTWIGDSLRFLDAEVTVRLVRGALELAAFGGVRRWSRPGGVAADGWAGASGALWLGRHLAVVGGGGSYPADYAQGFPAGRYLTLGLRLATARPGEPERAPQPISRPALPLPRPAVPSFTLETLGGDRRRVRIVAPGAHRVELMGDFTDWRPVALRRAGGSEWTAVIAVPPGVYRMNVRTDGGAWGAPAGLPVLRDEFGGVVALLRVE